MTAAIPKVGDIFEERYELLELIGSGGIGTVFKARQIDSGRLLALKVLHAQFAHLEEFNQRFLREGQALSKLSHAHIVTVYHLGMSESGVPYLAMELIEGVSLKRVLEQGKMAPSRAIATARQIASALSAMHAEGIIHRDLKPDNIVVMQSPDPDFAKIIDFGLVHMDAAGAEQQKLTSTGMVVGSADYMSPEQCRGLSIDLRADLYSFTICFYEMLTGKCPFKSDSIVGLMYMHSNEKPPMIHDYEIKPFHQSVNDFIQKGMQKDPPLRFQSAQEVSEALEELSDKLSRSSGIAFAGRPWFMTAALVLPLAAIIVVSLYLLSSQGTKTSQSAALSEKLSSAGTQASSKSISQKKRIGEINDELRTAKDPSVSPDFRCEAYLHYAWVHRTTPDSIEAVKAAKKLFVARPQDVANEYLGNRLLVIDAETLADNGRFDEAVPALEKLLEPKNDHMAKQDRIMGLALLAVISAAQGQSDRAAKYLDQACAADSISYPGIDYALSAAFKIDRLDLAKRLIYKVSKLGSAGILANRFRMSGHPDLADLAVDQGLKMDDAFSRPGQDSVSNHISETDFCFAIEEALTDIRRRKIQQARKILLQLASNRTYTLLDVPGFAVPLAVALTRADCLNEALEVVMKPPVGNDGLLNLVRADILSRLRHYKEARSCLDPSLRVIDPETNQGVIALKRLDQIEAGTADYKQGITKLAGYWS